MAKEHINTQMKQINNTLVSGKITKCTEKVYLPGKTVENMKEIMLTIKNKVMVYLNMGMEKFIKGSG